MPWLIPALMAGVVAIGVTVAIERFGGRKGGLLGTLPSTIIPAAIGLWLASPSVSAFQDALFMTPAGMLINAIYLLLWRVIPPQLPTGSPRSRLMMCLALTSLGWIGMAATVVSLMPHAIAVGLSHGHLALFLIAVGVVVGVIGVRNTPPAPPTHRQVGVGTLLARGVVAGAAIGTAIWLAAHGGAMVAGMAAVFPAIFLTTMCSLWLSHGESVGLGAVGPMMLGGVSVSAFAWIAAWWIPEFGPILGPIGAWLVAVILITLPAWWWLNSKA
jgi:hypothetical protein